MKQKVNIGLVKPNPNNPRYIKDSKFKKLVKSLKDFPKMLEKRPIVVDENMVVLGGNMRLEAAKSAGMFEVWIDDTEDWTEEEKRQFIIKDNVSYGEYDWEILGNGWTAEELEDWGMDIPAFDIEEEKENDNDISDNIDSMFRVEVELENEIEQEKLYNKLIAEGYVCRILTL